ncbi:rhodanese-like domain-containing protein [Pseudoalteromonas luteoviolacea]|uniref:rhodanese-like domain-containing protein n=1 Tax=Pseudoalteromonas luteoviolacea TaxID=43657 RepID=UPI001B373611|nr:rhodanese-like domain-containing protein [Pseudoalteromonas luteoviolacea]
MLTTTQSLIQSVKSTIRCIDANQAQHEIMGKTALLIDVREPHEHQQQAPKDAINIPRGMLEFTLPQKAPNLDSALYLHCAIGGRAVLAAEQLHRIGYTNITAIDSPVAQLCEVLGD